MAGEAQLGTTFTEKASHPFDTLTIGGVHGVVQITVPPGGAAAVHVIMSFVGTQRSTARVREGKTGAVGLWGRERVCVGLRQWADSRRFLNAVFYFEVQCVLPSSFLPGPGSLQPLPPTSPCNSLSLTLPPPPRLLLSLSPLSSLYPPPKTKLISHCRARGFNPEVRFIFNSFLS